MTPAKRVFDLVMLAILAIPLVPLIILIAILIRLIDGGPVFYISERMRTQTQGFNLIKFRTMTTTHEARGVSGGDKDHRITRTGRWLRPLRLDELPQLWNIARGDISFVGPRPPLREYVEAYPEVYGAVLLSRPGVTGLASLVFHRHEEMLLAKCKTAEETDAVYRRACIPRKATLDLIYQRNQSLCYDGYLMLKSIFRRL